MKQFFTVLKFELGNYFKNKSFVAATVVLAVILAAVITVPTLFMGNGSGSSQGEDGGGEAAGRKVLAVADESGSIADEESFASYLPEYQVTFCDGEESVRTMVEEEEAAAGFLVTGADSYEYILKNRSMMSDYQEPFEAALARNYRTASLEQLGIDPAEVENVYSVPMQSQTVVLGKDSAQNYWYTYILVFFLYFLIIFYGQMIAVSVTSEKSNRAIEILVTSVDSNSLIFGKGHRGRFGRYCPGRSDSGKRGHRLPGHGGRLGTHAGFHFPNSGPGVDDLYCIRDSGISALRLSVRHGGGAGVQDRRYQQEFRCGNLPVSGILSDYHVRPDLSGFPAGKGGFLHSLYLQQRHAAESFHGNGGDLGDCSLAGCSGCFLYPGGNAGGGGVPVRNSPVRKSH